MKNVFAVLFFSLLANVFAITYRGADISSLAILEASGQTYSDGSTKPLETILTSHGANLARIRIWVSDSSDYNLNYGVALARRAKAAGMSIMVDLHYSDTCRFRISLVYFLLNVTQRGRPGQTRNTIGMEYFSV